MSWTQSAYRFRTEIEDDQYRVSGTQIAPNSDTRGVSILKDRRDARYPCMKEEACGETKTRDGIGVVCSDKQMRSQSREAVWYHLLT